MAETQESVVLVGSSLTEASDGVVRTTLALARAYPAALHVAHALSYPVELFDSTLLSDRVLEELREKERAAVFEELLKQLRRLGVDEDRELHDLSARPGEPHRLLIDLIEEIEPVLVVVGAVETEDRITRAFGSTAGRVLRKAACPVLVARGELRVPPERVLLPVDLSPLSLEVARTALVLLDRLRGPRKPEVELLFVVTERDDRMLRASSPDEEPSAAAQRHLDRFVATCAAMSSLRPTGSLATGVAADEIVRRAEETEPDLVIVGTHGRSGFERLMIGSVAADVVRSVPTSVLVIPPATRD